MSLAQTFEIIPRLYTYHLLERRSEVFGILETHLVGNIADTQFRILLSKFTSRLNTNITNKSRHVFACHGTQFIIQRTGTSPHVSGKTVTVVITIVNMVVNAFHGTLQELMI